MSTLDEARAALASAREALDTAADARRAAERAGDDACEAHTAAECVYDGSKEAGRAVLTRRDEKYLCAVATANAVTRFGAAVAALGATEIAYARAVIADAAPRADRRRLVDCLEPTFMKLAELGAAPPLDDSEKGDEEAAMRKKSLRALNREVSAILASHREAVEAIVSARDVIARLGVTVEGRAPVACGSELAAAAVAFEAHVLAQPEEIDDRFFATWLWALTGRTDAAMAVTRARQGRRVDFMLAWAREVLRTGDPDRAFAATVAARATPEELERAAHNARALAVGAAKVDEFASHGLAASAPAIVS